MTEAILAVVLLVASAGTGDPAWAIAAGLFAIATNVNLLYHKEART